MRFVFWIGSSFCMINIVARPYTLRESYLKQSDAGFQDPES